MKKNSRLIPHFTRLLENNYTGLLFYNTEWKYSYILDFLKEKDLDNLKRPSCFIMSTYVEQFINLTEDSDYHRQQAICCYTLLKQLVNSSDILKKVFGINHFSKF